MIPGRHDTKPPRVVLAAGATLLAGAMVLTGPGCTPPDRQSDRDRQYCSLFPTRQAERLATVARDPTFRGGDPALAAGVVRMSANGVDADPPEDITGAAHTYAGALRSYQPGDDPLARPEVAAAASSITSWLGTHCGPVATTR